MREGGRMHDGISSMVTGGGVVGVAAGSVASSGVYARVAALLHESRRAAPDEVGSFLSSRVAGFGMRDLSGDITRTCGSTI